MEKRDMQGRASELDTQLEVSIYEYVCVYMCVRVRVCIHMS